MLASHRRSVCFFFFLQIQLKYLTKENFPVKRFKDYSESFEMLASLGKTENFLMSDSQEYFQGLASSNLPLANNNNINHLYLLSNPYYTQQTLETQHEISNQITELLSSNNAASGLASMDCIKGIEEMFASKSGERFGYSTEQKVYKVEREKIVHNDGMQFWSDLSPVHPQ